MIQIYHGDGKGKTTAAGGVERTSCTVCTVFEG